MCCVFLAYPVQSRGQEKLRNNIRIRKYIFLVECVGGDPDKPLFGALKNQEALVPCKYSSVDKKEIHEKYWSIIKLIM